MTGTGKAARTGKAVHPGEQDIGAVGEHFLVGLRPSTTLDARDRALLGELRPAGVVLFKSNFRHDLPYLDWLPIFARLLEEVRAAIGRERILIAIDHEGGRVCRTPPPLTRFSYAAHWAAQADAVGHAMGIELASLGINLSFAPVLDIHSNPINPVIGLRAFGETPERVAESALAFMGALQAEGVLACGKHFPGHGDTDSDSHQELPVLRQTLAALEARELKPFEAAIRAGIPMLMTAHILLPAIDREAPATLSTRINQTLLREQLGFRGVIVTDDIGMHAVSERFEDPAAAVQVFAAGADLLMVCAHWTDTDRCRGFARALLAAERTGHLAPELLESSRRRIRALLARARQGRVSPLPDQVFQSHRRAGALFAAETAEVI
ncbi:MAG TPA: beta-N-acetylhexosaminidase [Steroidobacteraceae bacterium]|nr:beta-N-acetylhexosaminidase [Steroidobacteraceae bacterium]